MKYAVFEPADLTIMYWCDEFGDVSTIHYGEAYLFSHKEDAEEIVAIRNRQYVAWHNNKYPEYPITEWAQIEEVEDEETWRQQPDTW